MNKFIKKNINILISLFILLSPIIDVLTGICVNTLNINFTFGIVFRILFLVFVIYTSLFVYKKKKLLLELAEKVSDKKVKETLENIF